jgi:hypothetical protein
MEIPCAVGQIGFTILQGRHKLHHCERCEAIQSLSAEFWIASLRSQ